MPKKKALFDEESEDEVTFKTENQYAKQYDKWRQKEELHKLEQKYGSKALNSDGSASSDSEDESDESPEVSEETEMQFLKALASLKTKDPRIYDPDYKFFEDQTEKIEEKKPETKQLSFADSDEDSNDGEIFKVEKKAEVTHEVQKKQRENSKSEEGKVKDFLTGKVAHIDEEVEKDLAPLKALWSDPKLNEGEAFLRDYILNKRYLEEGDAGSAEDKLRDDADLETDEQLVEEQGNFERAYNFRFEEPDDEYLKRYPRTMQYIRPSDDRRARARAQLRTRKEEEKRRKMEEIARMKALKLKEIQEKIEKIKEVTGNQELAFEEADIEADFDPEEHDRKMRALFDENYYGEADKEKPVFPELDEELEIENWEKYEEGDFVEDAQDQDEDGPHCEDEDFNMDADYDPKKARESLLEELKRNMGKKRRNRKKKSKLAEILATEKPKFIPSITKKSYNEFMEEYYKMDCEDVIGDLPTRFKYREVLPNDYGLTVEEILLADDKELTQWVPLKRIVKHRPLHAEKSDLHTYKQKAADKRLKRKILPSLFRDLPEEPEIVVPLEEAEIKSKKKKKNNSKETKRNEIENEPIQEQNQPSDKVGNENKNNQEKATKSDSNENDVQTNEVINTKPKKKKKKKKHKQNCFIVENAQNEGPSQATDTLNDNKSEITNHDNLLKRAKRKSDTKSDERVPSKKKKKNKANTNNTENSKQNNNSKMKYKQKDKFNNKQNNQKPTNPLTNLSDERLKAYGLNPKKYRSFLKYKKY